MRRDSWHKDWLTFTGRVRVVLDGSSAHEGRILVAKCDFGCPRMLIECDDGVTMWSHPRHVWPLWEAMRGNPGGSSYHPGSDAHHAAHPTQHEGSAAMCVGIT